MAKHGHKSFSDLVWALGLIALAWLHRAAFLLSNRDRSWPFTVFYQGDTRTFYDYAMAILKGVPYDNGVPFHPPGFPYFLSLIYQLVGADPTTGYVPHMLVRLLMALVGSFSVGLIFVLVRPYLGVFAALLTALFCLYHFGLYVISVAPLSESLYLTLLMTILLVWSRTLSHPLQAPDSTPCRGVRASSVGFGLGAMLGLLALTRAEGVLIATICIGSGLLGCWQKRVDKSRGDRIADLLPWACLVVGWVLALTPWTLRNAHHLRQLNERFAGELSAPLPTFVPLTIYGPLNLALANHPGADGTFSRDSMPSKATAGVIDITDPQHLDFLLNGHVKALRYMREHPGDFVRLVLQKWSLASEAAKLGWSQWNIPGGLNGTRRPVDMFVPDSGPRLLIVALTLLGLVFGLCTAGGPRRWSILVLCLSTSVMLTTGLFFGYARQWLLLLPFWFGSSASALVSLPLWLRSRLRGKRTLLQAVNLPLSRTHLDAFAAIVLLMLIVEGLGIRANRNYVATGTTLPGSTKLNPDLAVTLRILP